MIGVIAAIKNPEIFAHLVLVGPSPCYLNDGDYIGGFSLSDIQGLLDMLDKNHLGWSQAMAPAIMGNPDRPELAAELTESFCRTDPEIASQFARVTFLSDNRADLPLVKTPSLILQCAEDVIAPQAVGEYVHEHIQNSRLAYLRATGHCPHLSAPEETANVIRKYLEKQLNTVLPQDDSFADLPQESAEELYEHAPCGYLSTTPNGLIVRVNATFAGWIGYELKELAGRLRFSDLLSVGPHTLMKLTSRCCCVCTAR